MSGKLNVFNLGNQGVNTNKNPLQLEDGELTKAQNAIIDDEGGSEGSIRKRPGLTEINGSAAAGVIRGGIGVPIAVGTAGNDQPAVPPENIDFLVSRRIGATSAGWNTSTDVFATSLTTGGPDGYEANATPRTPDRLYTGMAVSGDTKGIYKSYLAGRPGCTFKNRLFYAGNDFTQGTTNPTLRVWDGTRDILICRVPSRDGVITQAVIEIIVGGDGILYLTTHDSGVNSTNTLKSRVFSLDPESGVLLQVGQGFPLSPETARVPFSIIYGGGRIWTRTHSAGISSVGHLVYSIRPGIDTTWTMETPEANAQGCNVVAFYNGRFFMGIPGDLGDFASIKVRSTVGVYTTSLDVTAVDSVPNIIGTGGYANCFGAMVVYAGNLYACYHNNDGNSATDGNRITRVYKYDGTSWTVVFNPAQNSDDSIPYTFGDVLGGRIFFVSPAHRDTLNTVNRLIYSSNGTSWTSVTSAILDNEGGSLMGAILG